MEQRIIDKKENTFDGNFIFEIYMKDGSGIDYSPSDGDKLLFDSVYCKVMNKDGTIKQAVPNSKIMSVVDVYDNLRYLKLQRILEICLCEHRKSSTIEDSNVSRYHFEEVLRRIMEVVNEQRSDVFK